MNGNKSDRQKQMKMKVQDTGTVNEKVEPMTVKVKVKANVKESEQAEPMKLKSVVEAVENCVLQQKQNLLNIKNKKGAKSEKNKTKDENDY